ncbi:aldolase [Aspergillus sclerotiicarbonarius CBS 121057]|uniref:2-isopropylmalate synthase n=1 Tax=Aspergillus sclerotiicarbonarius (strain CBS 121057 / IBT 28362) TaxID=1448318 RepID=A0A319E998_ASPSB|nr:aldolase [Aspergillus sclerotiicarbonarius CBS 121057]
MPTVRGPNLQLNPARSGFGFERAAQLHPDKVAIRQHIFFTFPFQSLSVGMPMLRDPSRKYREFPALDNPNRQWPSKKLVKPPRWLSTDLRDGNQALAQPMNTEQKLRYFQLLVQAGYKEIEACYPSASQTEFDFARRLIEAPALVPDDVWLQLMSPCREDLIRRTIQAATGAKKAIIHIYVAISPCFQQQVLHMSADETLHLAVKCTQLVRSLTIDSSSPEARQTEWMLQFTPETFQDSSMQFAVEICEAVKAAWAPTAERPIIFTLPATVEMAMPNVFADQIEYFSTRITEREKVCVSVHPHNDRGCAVAASELAQLAGADRVEGCLFGNGERTGNVDLVTLALNLYSQGIDPGVYFDNMTEVVSLVEGCTHIPVHARAPYAGRLAFCTFAGPHQDAIVKGHEWREAQSIPNDHAWGVPYLPIDPTDLGREDEAIIRVTAQSGKAGSAWVIKQTLGLDLPRALGVHFASAVTAHADAPGGELHEAEITRLFEQKYMQPQADQDYIWDYRSSVRDNGIWVRALVQLDPWARWMEGSGTDLASALTELLRQGGLDVRVREAVVQTRGEEWAAFVGVEPTDGSVLWSVGLGLKSDDAVSVALRTVLGGVKFPSDGKPNGKEAL